MPGAVVPRLRASELVSDQHAGFPNALQPETVFLPRQFNRPIIPNRIRDHCRLERRRTQNRRERILDLENDLR